MATAPSRARPSPANRATVRPTAPPLAPPANRAVAHGFGRSRAAQSTEASVTPTAPRKMSRAAAVRGEHEHRPETVGHRADGDRAPTALGGREPLGHRRVEGRPARGTGGC